MLERMGGRLVLLKIGHRLSSPGSCNFCDMQTQSLTALALLLAAAVICGLVMTRLRLPAAAGFILVGVGLGPTGAGLMQPTQSVETLADLGVLMLLFIIGMELRLQSFRKLLPLALGITFV